MKQINVLKSSGDPQMCNLMRLETGDVFVIEEDGARR